MADPQKVYDALDALGIHYDRYEHPPVFTSDAAAEHWGPIPATQIKNLFLRNKKGNRHYLVILEINKQADLRHLVKVIGDDRFSFGSPERLIFHPNLNTLSVTISVRDFERFLATRPNVVRWLTL
jgi:Ala-tRNA(Pro) deacylase